jgi:pseudaminic acid synthase
MKIANHDINEKVFIIAEISANHCGNYDVAKKMVRVAHEIGVDAVKLQTYTANTMTLDCKRDEFMIKGGTLWDGKYEYDLYQEAYTPWDWQPKLKKYADELGIILFSSAFDKTSVDFLEDMDVPAYKIASFEAVDIPLIEYAASKGKPMIISVGICDKQEMKEVVDACYRMKNNQVILLKCTSAYPAKLEDMNLNTMVDMGKILNVPVGLSDHSMDNEGVVAAVALGARVIEKHMILGREMGGPDSGFSLNVQEFAQMVQSVRNTEKLLGKITYEMDEKKLENRKFARSLFVAKDIKKGEVFTAQNIRSVRPGAGISPKYMKDVLGRKAKKDLSFGTPMSFEYLD